MGWNFLERFAERRLALLLDDLGESERGILVAPARGISADRVNEMLALTGGIFFVAVDTARAQALLLTPMERSSSRDPLRGSEPLVDMCVSVEARENVTTGISAADRAETVRILGEDPPAARKLVRPGHIVPVACRDGGVLVRSALPEGALDLVRILEGRAMGDAPAALFVDLLGPDGSFAPPPVARARAAEAAVPVCTLTELVRHRLASESLVQRVAEAKLPTSLAGELRALVYKSAIHSGEHIALVKGEIAPGDVVLTRVQPEFTFADVFGGTNPPTRSTLHRSLRAIGERGRGVLVYLRRTAMGELREQVEHWDERYRARPGALMREYGIGAQILRDLGITKIELLSSSTRKLAGITTFGIDIVQQTPVPEFEDLAA